MNIQVTPHTITITTNDDINAGEYNVTSCNFEFSEEYTGLITRAVFTTCNGVKEIVDIENNQCIIPSEVLETEGTVLLGVYGYVETDNLLTLRYSPNPQYFTVENGSYTNGNTPTPPTPSVWDELLEQVDENTNNIATNTSNITNLQETKADKTEIPTNISQLNNDIGYITNTVDNLVNYTLATDTGSSIELTIDSNYLMTLNLKNSNGTTISTDSIDLPLESMVIGATYDSATKSIILTLQNGNTLSVPVGDLITGLEETSNKVTTLSSSSTDTQYPSAKCVYDSQQAQDNASKIFINNIFNLKNYFQHQIQTGTEVSLNGTLEKAPMELMLKGNTEQDTTTGKNLFDISKVLTNGANLINNGDGTLTVKAYGISGASPAQLKVLAPTLQVNDVVYLYADSTSTNKFVYLQGTNQIWNFGDSRTITQQDLDSTVLWYGVSGSSTAYIVSNIMITKTQGATYEEYTGGIASPNPDYPQEVKVVTGDNEITVCGKNLLPNNQTTQTINGITFTINTDKSISVSGTSTAQTDLYLVGDASQYINLGLEAGNYNLSGVNNGSLSTYMLYCVQNRNGELSYYQSYTGQGLNISVQSGDTFRIFIRVLNGQIVNTVIYPQLEKGTPTSYEPYKAQNYEINLGKNLFDKNNVINAFLNADGTTTNNSTFRVSDYINVSYFNNITINGSNGNSEICCFYNQNKEFISNFNLATETQKTVSVPTNAVYLRVTLNSSVLNQYQVEKGTKATSYAPYFTPIELCKIGYYQDYLYKENGNWYKYSAIGKVVLNGSENWDYYVIPQGSLFRSTNTITNDITTDNKYVPYCNYYQGLAYYYVGNRQNNNLYISSDANNVDIIDNRYTNANDLKTWLSNNLPIVYYPLATLTPTQITEQTLINQLNAIEQAYSYSNQTNITQTNSNLPFIITADMMLEMS